MDQSGKRSRDSVSVFHPPRRKMRLKRPPLQHALHFRLVKKLTVQTPAHKENRAGTRTTVCLFGQKKHGKRGEIKRPRAGGHKETRKTGELESFPPPPRCSY